MDEPVALGIAEADGLDLAHVEAAHAHRRADLETRDVVEGRVQRRVPLEHVPLIAHQEDEHPCDREAEEEEDADLDVPDHGGVWLAEGVGKGRAKKARGAVTTSGP